MTSIVPTQEPGPDALALALTSLASYAELELARATASPARQREITAEQTAAAELARTAALVSLAKSLDRIARRARGPVGLGLLDRRPADGPRPPAVPPASGDIIGGAEQPRA